METKALNLIISKNVDIKWLKILSKQSNITYALTMYNDNARSNDKLTQEEFEFLKEVIAQWEITK